MEKTILPIKGMHCASCALTIEKTLNKIPGVKSCEVNFGTEKAKLEYNPLETNIEEMNNKIEQLGYSLQQDTNNSHLMPTGEIMEGNAHDHSEHLGLNQTKEQKLEELKIQKNKVEFVLPITITIFILMLWEISAMNFNWIPQFFIPHDLFATISFLVATVFLFWIGRPFLEGIERLLKYKVANMDTLVGIGTLTAYIYSSLMLFLPVLKEKLGASGYLYFDVTIIVIGFIFFGKYLESRSKLKTGEAIEKLVGLQSKTALVLRNGQEVEVSIEDVVKGDVIVIKPGSKIPVDGVITEGKSSIDESTITGEPIPVDKTINDTVIGGTINKQGVFRFKATKIGSETLLSNIIKMVEEAQGSKAPIQKIADRISGIFVPAVLIISVLTLILWVVVGSQFLPFNQAFSLGLLNFVGVLVIACPCALGLATPTAIIVGTGKGAQNGILIKDAESLEKLHKVNTIVTDKTGTITKGKPEVTDIIIKDNSTVNSKEEVFRILASLEKNSEHPLAISIIEKAKELNLELKKTLDFEIIEGKGLKGVIDDKQYYVGNLRLINELNINFNVKEIEDLTGNGKTPVFFSTKTELIAIIGISDTLKENAKETIKELHRLGIKVVMLTGDNSNTANFIAEQVGIDEVISEVLPNDKAEKVKQLQDKGNIVAMVGDGVNDAPALAQADVGIAMGTGTDIAIESASITLLKGDFSKVLKAIKLSKFTMNAIKQNLFWAFIYNIIGIPIAAGLLYPFIGILLNPAIAGAAMAFSSVSVVLNSLRLKLTKI